MAATDDVASGGQLAVEGDSAGGRQLMRAGVDALTHNVLESHDSRHIERRDLFREGGVRQPELVADELEVDPVGYAQQQRHNR